MAFEGMVCKSSTVKTSWMIRVTPVRYSFPAIDLHFDLWYESFWVVLLYLVFVVLDCCLLEVCYILKENGGKVDLGEREAGGKMEEVEGDETAVRMFVQEKTLIYIYIYIFIYITYYDSVSSPVDEHSLFLAIVKSYAKKT